MSADGAWPADRPRLGLCFHREAPAADVVEQARQAERLGYDEFWVIEDCFFTAGVPLAAAALVATERLTVGLGIMPAVARTAAMTAMEIATLADLAPGRFHAGIGHGVQEWMAQMGVRPESPLGALEEVLTAVRGLLAGDELTTEGRYVTLDRVALESPPEPRPLVSAGVRGPKSLALSGRCADGTILADFVSPDYVRLARSAIDGGAGRADGHRVTVFASMAVTPDGDEARAALAPFLAEVCASAPASLRYTPFFAELEERAERDGWLAAVEHLSPERWRTLGAIGTPDDAVDYCRQVHRAGADTIAVFPDPADPLGDAERFQELVGSRLRQP